MNQRGEENLRRIQELAKRVRELGLRMSILELNIARRRRQNMLVFTKTDPPCVCCGRWTDSWLRPDCRGLGLEWMDPEVR